MKLKIELDTDTDLSKAKPIAIAVIKFAWKWFKKGCALALVLTVAWFSIAFTQGYVKAHMYTTCEMDYWERMDALQTGVRMLHSDIGSDIHKMIHCE